MSAKRHLGVAFSRLLTMRMHLGMRLRWLALRAKDHLTSSKHSLNFPGGFRASTEQWYRGLRQPTRGSASITVIEDATTEQLITPVVTSDAHASFFRHYTYDCPRLFVVGIPGGRVLGETGEVMDQNGVLLADLSLMRPESVQPWVYKLHKPFRPDEPPTVEDLGRACTVVSQYASNNYFHWLLNLVPRFDLMQRAGVQWSALDSIVVNKLGSAFQQETLERIGIPAKKLVEAGANFCGKAEVLFATRSLRAAGHRCASALSFVRGLFRDCLSDSGGRRIYISRSDAATRRVSNEPEIAALLATRNIEVVSLSGMTVCDQARLFSEADVIVAPHGAGLANLTFSRRETKVIEILTADFLKTYYWELASARGLQYYCMISGALNKSTSEEPGPRDFEIVPDQLTELMDRAGV